jgi:hypothetical protein
MKVLFLDHDGVICLEEQWGLRFEVRKTNPSHIDATFDPFDEDAIAVLNEIIDATDCEIVISSDWRFHCSLNEMGDMFINRGIKKRPIGFTPSFRGGLNLEKIRSKEIKTFLEENTHLGITNWVAVDDLDMEQFLLDNFIWSPYGLGIKSKGVKENIINLLNQ